MNFMLYSNTPKLPKFIIGSKGRTPSQFLSSNEILDIASDVCLESKLLNENIGLLQLNLEIFLFTRRV